MNQFKKSHEWMCKTNENMTQEHEYKRKRANNEDTTMFSTRRSRGGPILIPKHNIPICDQTLTVFISETLEIHTHLKNKIIELEDKIQQLENK